MNNNILIPVSIMVAGAFIALAVFFTGGGVQGLPAQGDHDFANNGSGAASSIRAVSDTDHIFGNPDAKVSVIEFSDYECPFCARLHPTLERVVRESEGEVNWVYRHFPLTQIHPNAEGAAIAAECVARLSGNDAFWNYSSTLLNNQRSLRTNFFIEEAVALGIDEASFTICLADGNVASEVAEDFNEAINAGGRGTPFSVIVSANGGFFPFSGALPYEQLKPLVDQALAN